MNSVTKEQVIAEIVLRDLKKREHLKKIASESGFEYYTGGRILGLATMLLAAALLTWLLLRANVPSWGFMVCVVAMIGLAEATRQRYRFNALLDLIELEKQEVNKSRDASGDKTAI